MTDNGAMPTATYDAALQLVQQLTPAERRRLQRDLEALEEQGSEQPMSAKHATTLAVLDQLDQLAADIAVEWTDDMNAMDAVRDVRREL